jgi:hypothetical protein
MPSTNPPGFACIGIFAIDSVRRSDSAQALLKIALLLAFYQVKVLNGRFFHRRGKYRSARHN